MHGLDRENQFADIGALEDVSGSARPERLADVIDINLCAQHDDPTVGAIAFDQASRLDAIQVGHRDIHQHHIGPQLRDLFNRIAAVLVLGTHFDDVSALQQDPKGLAQNRMVVYQATRTR